MFLFYGVPTRILTCSLGVIVSKNPIASLLSLIAVFFNAILLLLNTNVEFLSRIFLIVYVGAIAILFLFVIRLLNLRNLRESGNIRAPKNLFLFFFFFSITTPLYFQLFQGIQRASYINLKLLAFSSTFAGNDLPFLKKEYIFEYGRNDIFLFSALLYTEHWVLLLLSGRLLLAARIGSLVLALSTFEEVKKKKTKIEKTEGKELVSE